jgi:hypothetical protein
MMSGRVESGVFQGTSCSGVTKAAWVRSCQPLPGSIRSLWFLATPVAHALVGLDADDPLVVPVRRVLRPDVRQVVRDLAAGAVGQVDHRLQQLVVDLLGRLLDGERVHRGHDGVQAVSAECSSRVTASAAVSPNAVLVKETDAAVFAAVRRSASTSRTLRWAGRRCGAPPRHR